jgi:phosphoribosylamine--glycine ligase
MTDRILVVGSGGREHTIVWKLKKDDPDLKVYCAPGNAGIAELAENIPVKADDIDGVVARVKEIKPDLTIVGPEDPLCLGLVDRINAEGYRAFGPTKAAAQLEGSKEFAKAIMRAAGVPTAHSEYFTNVEDARDYVASRKAPIVIKADGRALGKGVTVCQSLDEALRAVDDAMVKKVFGEAGSGLLVEDFLKGEEASILAFVDGTNVRMLPSAQDHKRAYDGDQGPNTGGMGAYSPAPVVTPLVLERSYDKVFVPTVREMARRGIHFKGLLYAGLMVDNEEPSVVEFNVRFGDPEIQAVMPKLENRLRDLMEACIDGNLGDSRYEIRDNGLNVVSVVMASKGYPGSYQKGLKLVLPDIKGIENAYIFHAGTAMKDRQLVTSGGRVLAATFGNKDLRRAISGAYEMVDGVDFLTTQANGGNPILEYRTDIAARALNR